MSMPDRMRNLWTLGGLSFADLLRRTARECWHDEVFGQGGRMAFYHFLAIFPSLLVLFTICARVPHVGDHMKNALQDLISQVLPSQASQLFQVITDELNDHTHSNVPLISVCAAGLWAALNGTWAMSFDGNHGLITTPPYTIAAPDQGQASSQPGHHKHGKPSGPPGAGRPRTQPSSRRALELPAADAVLVPGTTPDGPSGPTALVPTVDSVLVYQLSARGTWQQSQLLNVVIGMPRPLKR